MKTMHSLLGTGMFLGFALATAAPAPFADELMPPFRVLADGAAIDVEIGHAAPLVMDFDGDGKPDLLVGQFGSGKLRIYRNVGTESEPRFDRFTWFKAGSSDGKVPSG